MIYIVPPVPNQEPNWRIRVEYPEGSLRTTKSLTISEEVARVLSDKGVPVVLLGMKPVGATESALIDALDEMDRRSLGSKRMIKEIFYAIDILGEGSRFLLPQVYWDCRRAWKSVTEAQAQYETLHAELMRYAATKLGLSNGVVLVEGPHECIKSPTRSCLYDHDADRCHERCLVCGEPEERE